MCDGLGVGVVVVTGVVGVCVGGVVGCGGCGCGVLLFGCVGWCGCVVVCVVGGCGCGVYPCGGVEPLVVGGDGPSVGKNGFMGDGCWEHSRAKLKDRASATAFLNWL